MTVGVRMMQQGLHIVIASELYEFAGGCESWLKYFLTQAIATDESFTDVHIYHLFPREPEKSMVKYLSENPRYTFHAFKPDYPLAGSGTRTILSFTRYCLAAMLFPKEKKHIVLLVGSVYLAILGLLLHCRYFLRNNLFIIPWIRSIAAQEIARGNSKKQVIFQAMEWALLKISQGNIVNGQDTLASYRELHPSLAYKMRAVENAVNYKPLAILDIPDWSKNKIRCAYLGRFVQAKGFDDFLQSIKVFYENNPDNRGREIEFHIYGHGSLAEAIPAGVINHGAYNPAEVKDILAAVDVVVFLNRTNVASGLSHGLLEAMAAGRLIVAWGNPTHEQVLSDENAMILEDGNIAALVKTYDQLLSGDIDISVLRNKCEAARRRAQEYSIERHGEKFSKVVKEFLQETNG